MDNVMRGYIGGVAGRFPLSRNVQEYWENLSEKVDMVGPTRWPPGLYNVPSRMGAMLEVDRFDAEFFNISEFEANNLNPMLRHLLEVVYECIVDSGLPLNDLQQSRTGLYLGCFCSDTDPLETSRCANVDHVSSSPFLAGEVMRIFKLSGPVITVDTACSSSMAALDTACNDLMADRCKYAIVAGCNLIINPMLSQQMVVLNMLCSEGRSRVFDEAANGYVRAEAVAAILLSSIKEDCRRVYAGIRDIGVNCDGYKPMGITNPSSESQSTLMKTLYKMQKIDVNDIKYVEAHGTGTQAGDTAETAGIADTFCTKRKDPLLIGSVKSNMGHSEATAALASIIKCLLAMHHKQLPPNLNFSTANPKITPIVDGRLKVVTDMIPFPGSLIGINSFGFGGVNGHVILEKISNKDKEEFVEVQSHMLVPITARTPQGVEKITEFVRNNRYNSNLLALLSGSMLATDYRHCIRAMIQIGPKPEDFHVKEGEKRDQLPSVILWLEDFVWDRIIINKDLMELTRFQESLEVSAEIIHLIDNSINLMDLLLAGKPLEACTQRGMLAATAYMIAIFDCLEDLSVPLSGVVGCGLTEIVAAFFDGAIKLHQCLSIIYYMGGALEKFSKENSGTWQVYSLKFPAEDAYQLGCHVQVLSVQDADHVIISMETKHRKKVLAKIHQNGGIYRLLPMCVPLYTDFLSDLVEPLKIQFKDLLPAPKYKSCHMHCARADWTPFQPQQTYCLCDADYFSRLVITAVDQSSIPPQLPGDRLVFKLTSLLPVTGTRFRPSLARMSSMDRSSVCESHGLSEIRQRVTMEKFAGLSEDTLKSRGTSNVVELKCNSSSQSFFSCLGEMHIQGFEMYLSQLYSLKSDQPLACDTPSLSPLVYWNHTNTWNIPHWSEFTARIKDEFVMSYTLFEEDLEGIHSPMSMLLYHCWAAIAQRQGQDKNNNEALCPIRMYELVLNDELEINNKTLPGTMVQVHPGLTQFWAVKDDVVLLTGKFEVSASLKLPRTPGYDVDKNDNVEIPLDEEMECEKTEVMWEDSWLDLINDVLEFVNQTTEFPLHELTIIPTKHLQETEECAKLLVVLEKSTGLCKAGGMAMQFFVNLIPPVKELSWRDVRVNDPHRCHINRMMVYTLNGTRSYKEKVVVYLATRTDEDNFNTLVLGLMNVTGDKSWKEVPLPADWNDDNMEVLVPYILSAYILYDVAGIQQGQTILILPPLDTMGVYLLSLASAAGGSVFTGTWDMENQGYLENIFPLVRVLPGDRLDQNILHLTQGRGVDVCIRCSGGEVNSGMRCLSANGQMIQCIPPPPLSPIYPQTFLSNRGLNIIQPPKIFSQLMQKSTDDIQALLLNMQGEAISELSTQGFPEAKGVLYNLEDKSSFLEPLSLLKFMSLLADPRLGANDSALELSCSDDLNEADAICVERILNILAPKPKDFSMTEASMLQTASIRTSGIDLNFAMTTTPPVKERPASVKGQKLSPVIRIVDVSESSFNMGPKNQVSCPPTSTPMASLDGCQGNIQLEESYLDSNPSLDNTDGKVVSKLQHDPEQEVDQVQALKSNLKQTSGGKALKKPLITFDEEVQPMSQDKPTTEQKKRSIPSITICEPLKEDLMKPSSGVRRPATPGLAMTSFRTMMSQKSKPVPEKLKLLNVPRVDLLMLAPPMTPISPAVRDILTPSYMYLKKNLVPLNSLVTLNSLVNTAKTSPLYIVHPVLGEVTLLEKLGASLQVPCYGIQRTSQTPSDTIENLASYYKNSIEMVQNTGPYKVAGYSFGGMIAMEIALQFQAEGKEVEPLIMLDGSPGYVQAQISKVYQMLPTHATEQQITEAVEIGALLNWMSMYGPVKRKDLIYNTLRKLPTIEDKIDTAVDLTMGLIVLSENERKTKWLAAKEKVRQIMRKSEPGLYTVAQELLRLKRKEKANIFLQHAMMAHSHDTSRLFNGNIHLLRVKAGPIFEAVNLDSMYNLKEACTGSVTVKYYNGSHESFLTHEEVPNLTKDLHAILGMKG